MSESPATLSDRRSLNERLALILLAAVGLGAAPSGLHSQPAPPEPSLTPLAGDRYAKQCEVTPRAVRAGYPGESNVLASNKLARPAGKSQYPRAQRLYLRGRVFNTDCLPLKGARIEIWHRGPGAAYRYAGKAELANVHSVFSGAGRAKTDNRGEYLFETLFPTPKPGYAPYINIRVTHPSLRGSLHTTLYFKGDDRNDRDPIFQRLEPDRKQRLLAPVAPVSEQGKASAGVVAFHDLTIDAPATFRRF